ncbi:MAG: response regulator [Trueperaceae bacterium]|nr:response regulator [Trueperaceae bacterium]
MAPETVLIVDDEPVNVSVLTSVLRPHYDLRAATTGESALRIAASEPRPDLILLDVVMPGMDGFAVLRALREDPATAHVPVVFLTGMTDADDEERGLREGAADYVTKPIRPAVVLVRVKTQLEAKRARDLLRDENAVLEAEVRRRTADNDLAQAVAIRALAHLAEMRDTDTGEHIHRTQSFVRELALRLRHHPRFAAALDDRTIELITRSAPLHDIGKVGIPDRILLKPGPLDPDEWETMKTHAVLGADAIERAEDDVGVPVQFLALAREIARWHHERWDGRGYPDGLREDAIPIPARLMALADVFDALISPRVYKTVMSYDEARAIIVEGRGTHFDPDVVDAFVAGFEAFVAIAEGSRQAR